MPRPALTSITCWRPIRPRGTDRRGAAGKPVKARIVEQLLTDSGISAGDAEEIYQQLMDYLDGDTTTAKEGLETDAWPALSPRGCLRIR